MEIIIAIAIVVIGSALYFNRKKPETTAEVPYKVETPVVAEPTPVAEQATQAVVESIAPAKKPRAKKALAAKKDRS